MTSLGWLSPWGVVTEGRGRAQRSGSSQGRRDGDFCICFKMSQAGGLDSSVALRAVSFPSLCSHSDILGGLSNCLKNWLKEERHGGGDPGLCKDQIVSIPSEPNLAVFATALDYAGASGTDNLNI